MAVPARATRRNRAARALARGSSVTEAAQESGYHRVSISRLLHGDSRFQALVARYRAELLDQAEEVAADLPPVEVEPDPSPIEDRPARPATTLDDPDLIEKAARFGVGHLIQVCKDPDAPHRDRVKAASELARLLKARDPGRTQVETDRPPGEPRVRLLDPLSPDAQAEASKRLAL